MIVQEVLDHRKQFILLFVGMSESDNDFKGSKHDLGT
jgi:hypothetical protein